jgi:hypothetical protein
VFRRKRRVVVAVVGGIVILLAVAFVRLSPLWPGPGLPDGASRLNIATAAPHLVPNFGCPASLLVPVRVATSNDDLIAVTVATGEPVQIIWPSGWAAWRLDGRAELVGRDGSVVAREGDVIENRFGGSAADDGSIHICILGG